MNACHSTIKTKKHIGRCESHLDSCSLLFGNPKKCLHLRSCFSCAAGTGDGERHGDGSGYLLCFRGLSASILPGGSWSTLNSPSSINTLFNNVLIAKYARSFGVSTVSVWAGTVTIFRAKDNWRRCVLIILTIVHVLKIVWIMITIGWGGRNSWATKFFMGTE